ncbi:hypothetical protein Sjap_001265 [Stephania japonica]|uniref:Uncharacterized protein n=1 Tax=Stephania japonica TaxID=461633 RepID=A0AAP0KKJ2_9MAGN
MGDLLGSPPSSVVQGSLNLGTYPQVSGSNLGGRKTTAGGCGWCGRGCGPWLTLPVRCQRGLNVIDSCGLERDVLVHALVRRAVGAYGLLALSIAASNSVSLAPFSHDLLPPKPPQGHSLHLPPPPPQPAFHDLPDNGKIETHISLTVTCSLNAICDALKSFTTTKLGIAFIVDIFDTDAFDMAWEFKIKPYIFTTTALVLSFVKHLPELRNFITSEFEDLPKKLKLPGCVPGYEAYKWFLQHAKRYELVEGITVNIFAEPNPQTLIELKLMKDWPLIYFVGPLIQNNKETLDDERYGKLKWLDKQPHGSVLFVLFRSGVGDERAEILVGYEESK